MILIPAPNSSFLFHFIIIIIYIPLLPTIIFFVSLSLSLSLSVLASGPKYTWNLFILVVYATAFHQTNLSQIL
ncbi:MAG: hypothetical protein K7J15_06425, partial [Candidatus Regiella insecticola]|nr:hypothetical protein [Candidatus Regiella insecticola]